MEGLLSTGPTPSSCHVSTIASRYISAKYMELTNVCPMNVICGISTSLVNRVGKDFNFC